MRYYCRRDSFTCAIPSEEGGAERAGQDKTTETRTSRAQHKTEVSVLIIDLTNRNISHQKSSPWCQHLSPARADKR